MYTLGMANGDLAINEKGQPTEIEGTEKLCQDIAEALNSEYDPNKKFGGNLITMNVNNEMSARSEVYTILNRLMDLQDKASPDEKIKSIRGVQTVQQNSAVYCFIDVVSFKDEKISETFNILGNWYGETN